MSSEVKYSVGTWDPEAQGYSPQLGVPGFNLTLWQLKDALQALKRMGYSCHRFVDRDGEDLGNDSAVLVERTDGRSESEILKSWER